jgi:hypothetical protein
VDLQKYAALEVLTARKAASRIQESIVQDEIKVIPEARKVSLDVILSDRLKKVVTEDIGEKIKVLNLSRGLVDGDVKEAALILNKVRYEFKISENEGLDANTVMICGKLGEQLIDKVNKKYNEEESFIFLKNLLDTFVISKEGMIRLVKMYRDNGYPKTLLKIKPQ